LEVFIIIWYGEEDVMPRMMVMLYVASLLSQSHRAGANRTTQPDDVFRRPPVLVTDGVR
jgi:hypothetical protein